MNYIGRRRSRVLLEDIRVSGTRWRGAQPGRLGRDAASAAPSATGRRSRRRQPGWTRRCGGCSWCAGWQGFVLSDHVQFMPTPTVDPWVALAAIALATEQIRIGPLVTPLPRRRPVKLARETVSLDHLSDGRLVLGVGIGAGPWEWDYL